MSIIEIPDRLDSVHGLYLTRMILRTRLTVTNPTRPFNACLYDTTTQRGAIAVTQPIISCPFLSAYPQCLCLENGDGEEDMSIQDSPRWTRQQLGHLH